MISVVVPVRNEEEHLAEQLIALAAQTYRRSWELVIVDNGCVDRSMDVARACFDRLPVVKIVDASAKKGLNYARNTGAAAAGGDLLAFCDADDAATPRWLERLAIAARRADLVGGSFENLRLGEDKELEASDEPLTALPKAFGFRVYTPGGNCAVWTSVARDLRWDESFTFGSSDIEFSWRAQSAGYALGFAPDAIMRRRYPAAGWPSARRYFRYGLSTPLLYRQFRSAGMPSSDLRAGLRAWFWMVHSSVRAIQSRQFRIQWLRVVGVRSGRLIGSIRNGVLYL